MAIQVNGTTVIDNSRNLINFAAPSGNLIKLSSNALSGATTSAHTFTGLGPGNTSNTYAGYKLIIDAAKFTSGASLYVKWQNAGTAVNTGTMYNMYSGGGAASGYGMYYQDMTSNLNTFCTEIDINIDGYDQATLSTWLRPNALFKSFNGNTADPTLGGYLVFAAVLPNNSYQVTGVTIVAPSAFTAGTSILYGVKK